LSEILRHHRAPALFAVAAIQYCRSVRCKHFPDLRPGFSASSSIC
jgi:hypothetical protein